MQQRSFKYKCFNQDLPTLDRLKQRRADLYNSNEWTCSFCTEEETFDHLWSCKNLSFKIRFIVNKALKYLQQLILTKCNLPARSILTKLQLLSCWSLNSSNNNITFTDIMKGYVPRLLSDLVMSFGLSLILTEQAVLKFMNHLLDLMYTNIWLIRCENINNREASIGITKEMKKKRTNIRANISRFNTFPILNITSNNDLDRINRHNNSLDRCKLWCSLACQFGGSWQDFCLLLDRVTMRLFRMVGAYFIR